MDHSRLRPFAIPLVAFYLLVCPRLSLGEAKTKTEQALALSRVGRIDEAILLFKEVIASDSTVAGAWNNLAAAYSDKALQTEDSGVRERSLGEAIKAGRKAVELKSTEVRYIENLGNIYTDAGLIDSAIVLHQRAIELDPSEAGHYLDLGVAFDRRQDYSEAIDQVKQAITLNPYMTKARANLAQYYGKQDQWVDALEELIFLDDLDSWFPGLEEAKSTVARRALPELHKRLAEEPDALDLRMYLAHALAYQEKWSLAVEEADRLIEVDKENAEALKIAGLIFSWREDHKSAAKMFKRCVDSDGSSWSCYEWLGFSYLNLGEAKKARNVLQKAEEIAPSVAAVQMNLGTAYLLTGDYERAAKALRAAIRLGSNLGKVHYNLAACLTNLEEWEEALTHAQIAERKGFGPATSLIQRIERSR